MQQTKARDSKTMMHRGIIENSLFTRAHVRACVRACALTLQVLDLFGRLFGLLVVTSPLIIEQGCRQS